jgi:Arc-like DNA binding domain
VLLENRMSKKPSQMVQAKVRMREDLRRKIEHAAQKNGLTINAEILRRLDQTFGVGLNDLERAIGELGSSVEEKFGRLQKQMEQLDAASREAFERRLAGAMDKRNQS